LQFGVGWLLVNVDPTYTLLKVCKCKKEIVDLQSIVKEFAISKDQKQNIINQLKSETHDEVTEVELDSEHLDNVIEEEFNEFADIGE